MHPVGGERYCFRDDNSFITPSDERVMGERVPAPPSRAHGVFLMFLVQTRCAAPRCSSRAQWARGKDSPPPWFWSSRAAST